MKDAYKEHLRGIHSDFKISEELLNKAIKEAANSSIVSKSRIIAGEANEVYDIVLASGVKVIARISRDAEKHFEQELWAIEQCKDVGIIVPEILLIQHLSTQYSPLDICIQKKLDGDLLERGKVDVSTLSTHELHSILHEAGELLARIHTIPTKGWGYLDSEGRGTYKDFHTGWEQFMVQEKKYAELAQKTNFDSELIQTIFTFLDQKAKDVLVQQPVLTHNDFHPKHLMIEDRHVAGVIDFGEVSGHMPENDLAKWKYWDDEQFPLELLLNGYGREKLGPHFDDLMGMLQLEHGLSVLEWYDLTKYAKGVEDAKKKLFELAQTIH